MARARIRFKVEDDAWSRAHWRQDATPAALVALCASVVAFAADRGMGLAAQTSLAVALRAALERAAALADAPPPEDRPVHIDAAADSDWLTVRIRIGGVSSPEAAADRLVAALDGIAHRLQVQTDRRDAEASVLVELPMAA